MRSRTVSCCSSSAGTSTFTEQEHLGVLAVARRQPDGAYAVHVWHELYPWALKYLGLESDRRND